MRDFSRLDTLLDHLVSDVYPEVPMEPHITMTTQVIADLHRDGIIAPGQRVLDVGCGQGLALEHFAALGLDTVGINLGTDADICRAKGFKVRGMDQSFLDFADEAFDFLWCRHILEHSVFPLFTLSEYRRVVKPGGYVYIEVPAPDTACRHQTNVNHYSVLGKSMWQSLFERVGFALERAFDINFVVPAGPDVYWAFLVRK
jgi:SAM-dependent methyltransferase